MKRNITINNKIILLMGKIVQMKTGFKDLLYTHIENKTLNKIISTS